MSLVLVLLSSLLPQADLCRFPEVVAGGPTLTKLGAWAELAARIAPDARVTTEAEAIAAACKYQPN